MVVSRTTHTAPYTPVVVLFPPPDHRSIDASCLCCLCNPKKISRPSHVVGGARWRVAFSRKGAQCKLQGEIAADTATSRWWLDERDAHVFFCETSCREKTGLRGALCRPHTRERRWRISSRIHVRIRSPRISSSSYVTDGRAVSVDITNIVTVPEERATGSLTVIDVR